ncbi:MAG: redoxin domain-containing protein [Cytophagales bacterium]
MMKKLIAVLFICLCHVAFCQVNSPKDIKPLSINDTIPEGLLKNFKNESLNVKEYCKGSLNLIIFYRGGWCPFCNVHLSDLQQILGFLNKNKVKILAISGESPTELEKTAKKNELEYDLYQDEGLNFAEKMGVAFYENKSRKLPVPSVFLVDKDLIIRYAYWNADYKVRLESFEVKEIVKKYLKK